MKCRQSRVSCDGAECEFGLYNGTAEGAYNRVINFAYTGTADGIYNGITNYIYIGTINVVYDETG